MSMSKILNIVSFFHQEPQGDLEDSGARKTASPIRREIDSSRIPLFIAEQKSAPLALVKGTLRELSWALRISRKASTPPSVDRYCMFFAHGTRCPQEIAGLIRDY